MNESLWKFQNILTLLGIFSHHKDMHRQNNLKGLHGMRENLTQNLY